MRRTWICRSPSIPRLNLTTKPFRQPLFWAKVRQHESRRMQHDSYGFRRTQNRHILDEIQQNLDAWMIDYNTSRPHQGRCCYDTTLMQTFGDSEPLAKEKVIASSQDSSSRSDQVLVHSANGLHRLKLRMTVALRVARQARSHCQPEMIVQPARSSALLGRSTFGP
jgi:hypothetical protein